MCVHRSCFSHADRLVNGYSDMKLDSAHFTNGPTFGAFVGYN
jgi:hypothetical protein